MISFKTAVALAGGKGDGFPAAKVNGEEMKRACDRTLDAHGRTQQYPTPYDKKGDPRAERIAHLRALAIGRGEYKVKS